MITPGAVLMLLVFVEVLKRDVRVRCVVWGVCSVVVSPGKPFMHTMIRPGAVLMWDFPGESDQES
ncbi:hypothetical protein DVH05_006920 [Phytophthora capsici]|nr:hypothetical protein DVH05_006920 [Phytophthora capsici]